MRANLERELHLQDKLPIVRLPLLGIARVSGEDPETVEEHGEKLHEDNYPRYTACDECCFRHYVQDVVVRLVILPICLHYLQYIAELSTKYRTRDVEVCLTVNRA